MLTKQTTIDQITATENGTILIRETTKVIENGVELSSSFHRSSLMPGSDLTGQPASVVAVATATWTPANVTAWSAEFIALQEAERLKQVAAVQAAADAKLLAAVPSVTSVTMRQARLALMGAGFLDQVTAAIAAMPEPAKTAALIEWEYAATVERNSGLMSAIVAALGLSAAQLDALFATAAGL